ncbi:HD domain-containing protein, partial [Maribacter sp.]|uniref:HD domain-containing protein n=1 Tax=Maribacter sp. TaxID=1897614 RepID=UPI0032993720
MSTLVSKAEEYATDKLTRDIDPKFLYHNLRHTQRVVDSTKELIEGEHINDAQSEILLVAAWFHDLGYTVSYNNHEENSCKLAKDFLAKNNSQKAFIDNVCTLIMATKKNHEPKNELEKIIRDADSSHFHVKNFMATTE